MDNYQGDLTDIVRASGGGGISGETDWQFPAADPMSVDGTDMFQEPIININPTPLHGFGNPFSNMRDPLLHFPSSSSSLFAPNTSPLSEQQMINITTPATATGSLLQDSSPRFLGGGNSSSILGPKIFDDDHIMKPNRFSRMLQISTGGGGGGAGKLAVSPCGSPVVGGGSSTPRGMKTASGGDSMINANSSPQISSPRNPGIKRRKSQAKKVVCIPAPASANSRPTGEVVPSDLWAWRKYGQKPIKGSPYPRGYYRCSSSKGCSARKQVERSRTDPNMLVITYTSEHNHPWPTQRNALAGSTRSQPSNKSTNNNSTSANSNKPLKMATSSKEEQVSDHAASPSNIGSSSTVKEEMHDVMEKQLPEGEEDGFSYRPAMPDMSEQDSFFADLDEIEADPLHLLFTQGFTTSAHDHEKKDQGKALDDQFCLFDWSEDNNKGL